MKTIKIRYIENYNSNFQDRKMYNIQRKALFGWKTIGYECAGYGGSVTFMYSSSSKESLLSKVIDEYYNTCMRYIRVIEYPSIKVYQK